MNPGIRYGLVTGLVLLLMGGEGNLVPASEPDEPRSPADPLEALKLLQKKKAWEEAQLRRLSDQVLIPAGEFRMGTSKGEPDEKPAHRVYLEAFYLDKYEVTQLQYETVVGKNPSYFKNCPLCPVEKVTYEEARNYCRQVGKRLPTEAEWEKAAKGGIHEWYYWKTDHPDDYAWYGNNSGKRTHPVGEKEPNPYGLHDMAGNVWEWVRDWYDPDYYRSSPRKNPPGPAQGTHRVVRGGAWGHLPVFLRHTYRENYEPHTRYIIGGFRCASDVEEEP